MGGHGCLASLPGLAAEATADGARLFMVTDRNVDQAWGQAVRGLLAQPMPAERTLALAAGEESKTVQSLERCWDWLAAGGARRDDIVVALGGGVVGDLAGFAAATYQRGRAADSHQPLAQVDSSVGEDRRQSGGGQEPSGALPTGLVVVDPIPDNPAPC
jgi:3-dehydroquinate synthetase